MAKRLPDLQVLIPYQDLLGLLRASEKVDSLQADNDKLREQLSALRSQFTELMEAFKDLRAFVQD